MKSLFLFIVATAFVYGLFSFFYLSIDPHVWGEGGRYLFCIMEFTISLAFIAHEHLKQHLKT